MIQKEIFFMSCLYIRYSAQVKCENCAVRGTGGSPAAVQFYRKMSCPGSSNARSAARYYGLVKKGGKNEEIIYI